MGLDALFDKTQTINDLLTTDTSGHNLYGAPDPEEARFLNSVRQAYRIPAGISDAQVKQWAATELPKIMDANRKQDGGFLGQVKELGGPVGFIAASALGGPMAGSLAAANGSGATGSLGIDPRLVQAGSMAYGAYNSPGSFGSTPSDAVAGSEYGTQDWTNGATGAGGGNGGNMDWNFDDFTGDWTQSSGDQMLNFPEEPTDQYGGPTGMELPSDSFNLMDIAKKYGPGAYKLLQDNKGILSTLARGAPAALGMVGANQQAQSLRDLSDKYMALGAPSRARYEASFQPGFSMANDPGYQDALDQSSKATLHGLSVAGNPAGSPNAWSQSLADNYAKTAYPALQNFRNTNANAGGIASLQTAAPAAASGAIGAQANVFNAAGAGLNDIFNPPKSLAETMAEYRRLMGGM